MTTCIRPALVQQSNICLDVSFHDQSRCSNRLLLLLQIHPPDDSVVEKVRSQRIVSNGSEISRSTGNCVETPNLLFIKAAPRTLSDSNESLPSTCTAERRLSQSRKKKKRGENKLYCSCQNFTLSESPPLQVARYM